MSRKILTVAAVIALALSVAACQKQESAREETLAWGSHKEEKNMNVDSKRIIHTDHAPRAIGTYSQAVQVGQMLYVSGQIGLDPVSMSLAGETTEQQLEQTLQNLGAILTAAGVNFSSIVKLNVFLTNLDDFPLVNSAMKRYFSEPYPARVVIGVSALPKGAKVEIDAIAAVGT